MIAFRMIQFGAATALLMATLLFPAASHAQDTPQTIGMSGRLEQVVLPGSKLMVKPYDSTTPVVVRIAGSWPHGTDWRYDLEYFGLEPGTYNLIDFLQREDGSSTGDLRALPVEIVSLLPDGQVVPHELDTGLIPRLGGYRFVAASLVAIWVMILGWLVFYRGKGKSSGEEIEQPMTLLDYLRPRLQAGMDGQLHRDQFAELERMIFAYWRGHLGLEELEAKEAMARIKQHPIAGPQLTRLEQAMHDPKQVDSFDLARVLEPYRDIADAESQRVEERAVATEKDT